MTTENLLAPQTPYEGFRIEARLLREVDADGTTTRTCALTATELAGDPTPLVFERCVFLSQGQAALRNLQRPGAQPAEEQLDADLLGIGVRYIHGLIDVANRGFRMLAPAATRSFSETRSRLGMTDAALRLREG
jgi:hypothetical protein